MKEGELMVDLEYHENIVNLQGVTANLDGDQFYFYLVSTYMEPFKHVLYRLHTKYT